MSALLAFTIVLILFASFISCARTQSCSGNGTLVTSGTPAFSQYLVPGFVEIQSPRAGNLILVFQLIVPAIFDGSPIQTLDIALPQQPTPFAGNLRLALYDRNNMLMAQSINYAFSNVTNNVSSIVKLPLVAPASFTSVGAVNITVVADGPFQMFLTEDSGAPDLQTQSFVYTSTTLYPAVLTSNVRVNSTNVPLAATVCDPPAIKGDPMFVGLRGQKYQVHGIDGVVYNLITDTSFNVNSRFVFLDGPRPCPTMPSTDKRTVACWSHPGSYLSNIAVSTSDNTRLLIQSGSAYGGFSKVILYQLNHEDRIISEISINNNHKLYNISQTFSIIRFSTHEVSIIIGSFQLIIENGDDYINLSQLKVLPNNYYKLKSHGLIGQTWSAKRYYHDNTIQSTSVSSLEYVSDNKNNNLHMIEGEIDDYVIIDNQLFGDEFVFNRMGMELNSFPQDASIEYSKRKY